MKKMKSKKILWISVAALACMVAVGAYIKSTGGTAVELVTVEKGEMREFLEDTAVVQSKDRQTVYVEGSGKITNIRFDAGDAVKQGDILLEMDKADLELQLRDANAKVEGAKAQLKGTELINYANRIEIAKASVEQARVAQESAFRNYENARKFFEAGSMSKEDHNKAQDAYKAAQATLNAANLQLEDLRKGTPDYVKNSYMSQLEQALVFRDNILRSLEKMQVKAPIEGILLERLVEKNSPGTPGKAAFVIGNVKQLELEANILADDSARVKAGNEVEISGKAMDGMVLKGKVVKVAPSAKTVTSTLGINQKRVPVTVELMGETGVLKPGYNVDIKIITTVTKDSLTVPDTAVFDYKGKTCVFTVENGKTVLKEVKKGIESDRKIEVLEGIKAGDLVVVKPDNNIKENMKVKGKEE